MIYLIIAVVILIGAVYLLFRDNLKKKEELKAAEAKVEALDADREKLRLTLWRIKELEEEKNKTNHAIDNADTGDLLDLINGMLNDDGSG